jgi:hypothetical protein
MGTPGLAAPVAKSVASVADRSPLRAPGVVKPPCRKVNDSSAVPLVPATRTKTWKFTVALASVRCTLPDASTV